MNTSEKLYEFSTAQLRLTNRKQAASEAGCSPQYVAAMSRAGFTRSRLITAAHVLDWRLKNPDFRMAHVAGKKKKKGKKWK